MKMNEILNESIKKQSIRDLTAKKDDLLDEYHAAVKKIDDQIEAIRNARGQKLKEPDWSGYREQGRDRDEHHGPRGAMG